MSIIPFAIAWYFAVNPENLKLGTNHGELISPIVTTDFSEFSGYDRFSAENLKELQGHWVLINVLPQTSCSAVCLDAFYKTRQISLMMGKDISRLRRAAVLKPDTELASLTKEWQEDGRLLKVLVSTALQEKIRKITANSAEEGGLIIMDPLGNLMMKYSTGYDPYQVRNDLSKLLKISQIG